MYTILVIDDDFDLYSLIRDYLAGTEFTPEHAGDAESGLARLTGNAGSYDLVILDIMLPGMDGMEALRHLRAFPATSELPILMLTGLAGDNDKIAGFEAGADDYLAKPFSLAELAARMRAILRRSDTQIVKKTAHRNVLRLDSLTIDRSALVVEVDGKSVHLTPMEMRLLEFLVAEPGKTVSREILQKTLSGNLAQSSARGLDMTVSRLRKKLGRRTDGSERIQAAWGEGYVFLREGEGA